MVLRLLCGCRGRLGRGLRVRAGGCFFGLVRPGCRLVIIGVGWVRWVSWVGADWVIGGSGVSLRRGLDWIISGPLMIRSPLLLFNYIFKKSTAHLTQPHKKTPNNQISCIKSLRTQLLAIPITIALSRQPKPNRELYIQHLRDRTIRTINWEIFKSFL